LNKKKKSKVCLLYVPHANSPASFFRFQIGRTWSLRHSRHWMGTGYRNTFSSQSIHRWDI
jgi:hypothetical protein